MKTCLDKPLTVEEFEALLTKFSLDKGVKLGAIAQPLRVALTGKTASPGLFDILHILGPTRTLARIDAAIAWSV